MQSENHRRKHREKSLVEKKEKKEKTGSKWAFFVGEGGEKK